MRTIAEGTGGLGVLIVFLYLFTRALDTNLLELVVLVIFCGLFLLTTIGLSKNEQTRFKRRFFHVIVTCGLLATISYTEHPLLSPALSLSYAFYMICAAVGVFTYIKMVKLASTYSPGYWVNPLMDYFRHIVCVAVLFTATSGVLLVL